MRRPMSERREKMRVAAKRRLQRNRRSADRGDERANTKKSRFEARKSSLLARSPLTLRPDALRRDACRPLLEAP